MEMRLNILVDFLIMYERFRPNQKISKEINDVKKLREQRTIKLYVSRDTLLILFAICM